MLENGDRGSFCRQITHRPLIVLDHINGAGVNTCIDQQAQKPGLSQEVDSKAAFERSGTSQTVVYITMCPNRRRPLYQRDQDVREK